MNNIDDPKMETSGSSGSGDSFLPPKKRIRLNDEPENALIVASVTKPVNDEPENALIVASVTKPVAVPDSVKYKGVVKQANGHWGAQIYANHQRIWLGTFNSAVEAAMAYDSASIKLRSFEANSHRNIPWDKLTSHEEPAFQDRYTTKGVLDMIREKSYQQEFRKFLGNRSQNVASINIGGSKQVGGEGDQESNKCARKLLFQKELTPSDVGKLNRLVIPKKNAVKYLPFISEDQSEKETSEGVKDVEVVFDDDTAKRQWKFRYCYWKSSQSFVFTRGWNGFVKEKNLKEKDVIVFYTCDDPNKNLMIDVDYFSGNGRSVVPEEVSMTVHDSSAEGKKKTENFVSFSSKLRDEETKSEEKKGSVMLFGVRIQCS